VNIGSTDGLILLHSLAEQDRSVLVRKKKNIYIYISMHKEDASSNWTYTVSLLSCWHLHIQARDADIPTPPASPVLSCLEMRRCSHTWSWPLETPWPIASKLLHLLASWFGLILITHSLRYPHLISHCTTDTQDLQPVVCLWLLELHAYTRMRTE